MTVIRFKPQYLFQAMMTCIGFMGVGIWLLFDDFKSQIFGGCLLISGLGAAMIVYTVIAQGSVAIEYDERGIRFGFLWKTAFTPWSSVKQVTLEKLSRFDMMLNIDLRRREHFIVLRVADSWLGQQAHRIKVDTLQLDTAAADELVSVLEKQRTNWLSPKTARQHAAQQANVHDMVDAETALGRYVTSPESKPVGAGPMINGRPLNAGGFGRKVV